VWVNIIYIYIYLYIGVDENSEYNSLKCLITGVAYLEVYCQVNYTGPELSNSAIEPLITIPLDKREGTHMDVYIYICIYK
jgi:hypothetical protein